jgi:hypothetical protein
MELNFCFKVELDGHIIVYVIAPTMTDACVKVEKSTNMYLERELPRIARFGTFITSCERLGGYAITE